MAITKSIRELVREANKNIETVSLEDARSRLEGENTQFVDLRDIRELWREGTIPGALHVPRGMIEFWADPESPYHKPVFASDKTFLLFCASGWRSALATNALVGMGMANVEHIESGFTAWSKNAGPLEPAPKK